MAQKHIRKPYTKKDFSWVSYTARGINRVVEQYIKSVHDVYEGIKNIPKEKQTFENTILAYSGIHEKFNGEDSPLSLLLYLSTKKTVRDACHAGFEKISKLFFQYSFV